MWIKGQGLKIAEFPFNFFIPSPYNNTSTVQ